jgi:hypothetical protein
VHRITHHDLPRTAVDHAHQVRPAHGRTRPDLGQVRLPDLIWLGCFHASPLFLPSCSQRREHTSNPRSRITRNTRLRFTGRFSFRRSHQATRRYPYAGFSPQAKTICSSYCRSARLSPWLLPVIQTRPADGQRRRCQRGLEALRHHLSRLGVNRTTAHSPTTFFWISISSAFRPSVRSNCRMRWPFSVSAAAALLPPSAASLPVPLHRSSDKTDSERSRDAETFPLLMPS